jgi:type IV pilus assembly protein PilB
MTIEDPVEMDLSDVVQTQVDEDFGFNFATGLKSLLRNDPDIVLIGEIRDEETANIAVRAAMTGHLVITTVHANSPVGGIKRILNLKVDPTLLSDCLLGVFNQRLIRIYCEECADKSKSSDGHKASLPHIFDGCEKCFGTGFSQRKPVMSHFLMTSEDKKMLEENPTKLLDSDTMIEEANAMHKSGLTPYFEVNKLKMN